MNCATSGPEEPQWKSIVSLVVISCNWMFLKRPAYGRHGHFDLGFLGHLRGDRWECLRSPRLWLAWARIHTSVAKVKLGGALMLDMRKCKWWKEIVMSPSKRYECSLSLPMVFAFSQSGQDRGSRLSLRCGAAAGKHRIALCDLYADDLQIGKVVCLMLRSHKVFDQCGIPTRPEGRMVCCVAVMQSEATEKLEEALQCCSIIMSL